MLEDLALGATSRRSGYLPALASRPCVFPPKLRDAVIFMELSKSNMAGLLPIPGMVRDPRSLYMGHAWPPLIFPPKVAPVTRVS